MFRYDNGRLFLDTVSFLIPNDTYMSAVSQSDGKDGIVFRSANGNCGIFALIGHGTDHAREALRELIPEGATQQGGPPEELAIHGLQGAKIAYEDAEAVSTAYAFELPDGTDHRLLILLFQVPRGALKTDIGYLEEAREELLDSLYIGQEEDDSFESSIEAMIESWLDGAGESDTQIREDETMEEKATKILLEALQQPDQRLTLSWIQRRFNMGYGMAARIMEWLEEQGYVQSYQDMRKEGVDGRRLLVSEAELRARLACPSEGEEQDGR